MWLLTAVACVFIGSILILANRRPTARHKSYPREANDEALVCRPCAAALHQYQTRTLSVPSELEEPIFRAETTEEQRKREKQKWLQNCYAQAREVRQNELNWCKDEHQAWDEEYPGYYSDAFKACCAEVQKRFEARCAKCRKNADEIFGPG